MDGQWLDIFQEADLSGADDIAILTLRTACMTSCL